MIITMLTAVVADDQTDALLAAYADAVETLDDGLEETYLIHSETNPAEWRIVTMWRDREALEAMRATRATPGGVLIFRAADAEPTLAMYSVASHAVAQA